MWDPNYALIEEIGDPDLFVGRRKEMARPPLEVPCTSQIPATPANTVTDEEALEILDAERRAMEMHVKEKVNMSRRESNGFLKSIAKDLAKRVLNCWRLLGLALLGLLMIIGVCFSIVHFNLGIFGVYAAATALIVLMGWVVYGTDRGSMDKRLRGWNYYTAKYYTAEYYLDIIDMVLICAAWFVFIGVTATFEEDRAEAYGGLLLPIAMAVMWIRRRFFPSTVVRFQSKNAFLRTTSIFCIGHSVVTALFGVSADMIDSPALYARIFYLITGLLVLLAVWVHRIESRRSKATEPADQEQALHTRHEDQC